MFAVGGRLEHDAGELAAADPGEGRLPLVLAPDLEQVEEVCAAGADRDEVFVGLGGRGGDGGDGEVRGAFDVLFDLHGFHGDRREEEG